MRTKRLRRYEAPLLVKRESLPIVAAEHWETGKGHEDDDDWQQ
jgi:hypothetical protein